MNLVDSIIATFDPERAFRRIHFRNAMKTYAAYEAAKPGRLRKGGIDNSSGDVVVDRSGANLRGYARQLDQNHDIARGVLNTLVNNVVGPNGISVEPQPMDKNGDILEDLARELSILHEIWSKKPEVTHEYDRKTSERLTARSWFRDGECLKQFLTGPVAGLQHGTVVPFSVELIEADYLPISLTDESKGIVQGVEKNAWGRATGYHVYKKHPSDLRSLYNTETKRIPAERITHLKHVDRIKQTRGVSVFASVMRRLEDLKDYEESERIAARVAAAMTAFIKKGNAEMYNGPDGANTERHIKMQPGMVADGLQIGEEIGTIQSNRPSILLEPFRNAMMKAVSAGTSTNYSSVARDYDGSYASQRQELVEGWRNYEALTGLFISQDTAPTYVQFVNACVLARLVNVPANIDIRTIADADFRGPAMPWIDPEKEVKGKVLQEQAGYKSAQQNIRESGGNPDQVRKQIKVWRMKNDDDGLVFITDSKHELQAALDSKEEAADDKSTKGE